MVDMELVEILLSTYNGEKYLVSQLESLKTQTYPNVRVRIRDDGSTDSTRQILKQYVQCNNFFSFSYGENIGVFRSFWDLLQKASNNCAYVAFCDQDDVWDKDKISKAIKCLRQFSKETPTMYCSGLRIVDQHLVFIRNSEPRKKEPGILNALVENVATGCTIVINRAAINIVKERMPDFNKVKLHDRLIYLAISSVGKVIYDPSPSISYRQHQQNVVGSSRGIKLWWKRLIRFKYRERYELVEQAKTILECYNQKMSEKNKNAINSFIVNAGSSSILRRFKYIISQKSVYRQKWIDDISMRCLILLGYR